MHLKTAIDLERAWRPPDSPKLVTRRLSALPSRAFGFWRHILMAPAIRYTHLVMFAYKAMQACFA
jgi:hypothetical protein